VQFLKKSKSTVEIGIGATTDEDVRFASEDGVVLTLRLRRSKDITLEMAPPVCYISL